MSRPLFAFGTLRDPEVLALVLARNPSTVPSRAGFLPDHRTVRFPGESYPVLAPASGSRVPGMLLDLDGDDLARVAFFEGDEYGFDAAEVCTERGEIVSAILCAERTTRDGARARWALEAWAAEHKADFLDATRVYMDLFGRATLDEADRVWKALTRR